MYPKRYAERMKLIMPSIVADCSAFGINDDFNAAESTFDMFSWSDVPGFLFGTL
jgi:hypothetical protein